MPTQMDHPTVPPTSPKEGASVLFVLDGDSCDVSSALIARRHGYDVVVQTDARLAIAALGNPRDIPDLLVCGVAMDAMEGLDFIGFAHQLHPELPIIGLSPTGQAELVVRALRRGAVDVVSCPPAENSMMAAIRRAMEFRLQRQTQRDKPENPENHRREIVIGESDGIRSVYELIERIAPTQATALIMGESGTGKEVVVRTLHDKSPRRNAPFIAVNCGALPESLLEAELFGYERGAFTGADRSKPGRFELADGGTVFLDEIGEVPLSMQVRLLRFLQEREFERLGGTQSHRSDVRVIAATNRDLAKSVRDGLFRADLYYRLAVVSIEIPPLRERADEIPLLAAAFVRRVAAREGIKAPSIDPDAMCQLLHYDWPGNVRELENAVERAVLLSRDGQIRATDLPDPVFPDEHRVARLSVPLGTTLREVQDLLIAQTLRLCQGDKRRAAMFLGTSPRTITRHSQGFEKDASTAQRPRPRTRS